MSSDPSPKKNIIEKKVQTTMKSPTPITSFFELLEIVSWRKFLLNLLNLVDRSSGSPRNACLEPLVPGYASKSGFPFEKLSSSSSSILNSARSSSSSSAISLSNSPSSNEISAPERVPTVYDAFPTIDNIVVCSAQITLCSSYNWQLGAVLR